MADTFPFDHLDTIKPIPEELVRLPVIGRLVLDCWPDNVFAETGQVAFCPSHLVPGIDFSNDPLLQGRLPSHLDTQLSRLGPPNFARLPINAPKCPFACQQRDGQMQMAQPSGRVAYEPSSLAAYSPRESATTGFVTAATPKSGAKGHIRAESFADHYSQVRQFWHSQTGFEQAHIAAALVVDLSKVARLHVKQAMVDHLRHVDQGLAQREVDGLGLPALPAAPRSARPGQDLPPFAALQILGKMRHILAGRSIGTLVADGANGGAIAALKMAALAAGASVNVVIPKVSGVKLADGSALAADGQHAGTPSAMFDAVAMCCQRRLPRRGWLSRPLWTLSVLPTATSRPLRSTRPARRSRRPAASSHGLASRRSRQ